MLLFGAVFGTPFVKISVVWWGSVVQADRSSSVSFFIFMTCQRGTYTLTVMCHFEKLCVIGADAPTIWSSARLLWKNKTPYGRMGIYQDMSCRIAHASQLSENFEVKTGAWKRCLLSLLLFFLIIDWIMKITTTGRNNGIQWTLWMKLDVLDFADDLVLLSHDHSQM